MKHSSKTLLGISAALAIAIATGSTVYAQGTNQQATQGTMMGNTTSMMHGQNANMPVQAAPVGGQKVLQGLGSQTPNRPDVSLSPKYHVYEWKLMGATFVQVNTLKNEVLGLYVVGPAVGQNVLTKNKVAILLGASGGIKNSVTSAATSKPSCPCSGTIVAQGSNWAIVVVTDSQGNVIAIFCVGAGCTTKAQ